MPNPPESKWFATPRALRRRKPLSVTLSDKARERLESLAHKAGLTLSAAVEALVLAPITWRELAAVHAEEAETREADALPVTSPETAAKKALLRASDRAASKKK